nr:VCBS domain-containing protein [Pseudovibrio axinellae]
MSIVDPDAGQNQFVGQSAAQGAHGSFTVQPDGSWSYALDNQQPAVQGLKSGDQLTDSLTVTSVDGTSHKLTITINGTDDKAQIGGTATGTVTEETALTTSGQLSIVDPDAGEAQFVGQSAAQGAHGSFTVQPDGSWSYALDNQQPAVQGLKSGDQLTDSLTVTSVDGTTHKLTITIHGTDDKAQIGGTATGTVTEETALTTSGQLSIVDPDAGQNQFVPQSHASAAHGTFTVQPDGSWSYALDNQQPAVQGLKSGDQLTDSLTVTSVDGTSHKLTITIHGTDDKAQIGGTATGTVTEETALTTSGQLSIVDPDAGEAQFVGQSAAQGAHGSFTVQPDGSWSYALDNQQPAVQGLKSGDQLTDSLTVTSVDGTTHKLTITINGTDDKAQIGGTATGTVTEETALTTGGQLTVTDPDAGEAQFVGQSAAQGAHGTFTVQPDGSWSYALDNQQPAVQGLKSGDQLTDSLTVTSVDGTSHKLTITIHGTDDKAQIGGTATGTVTEETALTTGGQLTVTDPDAGEAQFVGQSAAQGAHGSFTVQPDGSWSYALDNQQPAVQGLKSGDQLTDSLTVTSIDGTSHKLTITINGTDDKAQIGGVDTGDVTENTGGVDMSPDYAQPGMLKLGKSALFAHGKLTITDPDAGEAEFDSKGLGFTYSGRFGDLLLNADGSWDYHADAGNTRSTGGLSTTRGTTIDQLGAGQSVTDTITVYSKDGTAHDINITIHGSNDRPYCSSEVVLQSGKEDTTQTLTSTRLLANTVDVDANDAGKLTIENLHADHGSIRDNQDGTYTFTPEKDYSGQVHLTYDVKDANGGVTKTGATTSLAAVGDAAVITDTKIPSVTEDRGYINTHYELQVYGHLDITDPDPGEAAFDINRGSQTYQGIGYNSSMGGHVLLQRNGDFIYYIDNRKPAIQQLGEGQTATDTVTVRSVDGTTHQVQITIHGTNDAPVLSAATATTTEGGTRLTGQMSATDVDSGDSQTYSMVQTAPAGFALNADGSWSFDPTNAAYEHLAAGATQQVSIPVTVTDKAGASDTQNLVITLTGTSNAAVIGGVDTGDVTENTGGVDMSPDYAQPGMSKLGKSPLYAHGKLTITDPDAGEAEFDSKGLGFTYSGRFGDLLLNADGSWDYHADAGNTRSTGGLSTTRGTTIDQLGAGQSVTDTITVYSKDGTAHDINITIHGSNDRPYCSSEVVLQSWKEDTTQTLTSTRLLANTVDVDANDAGKLTIENLHADHGSIRDNQDGTYTFTPEKDYSGQVNFGFEVHDGHGGVTHTGATTTLAAVRDKAIITGTDTGSATEDKVPGRIVINGDLDISDPDGASQERFQFSQIGEHALSDPFGGHLRIDASGSWSYWVDNNKPQIQQLAAGQEGHATYQVSSADGTTHQIQITIHGTNDAPVLSAATASATEGGTPISGQMSATDVDNAQSSLQYSTTAQIDGFQINANGHYQFDPSNAAYNSLAEGALKTITIPVTVTDGDGGQAQQNLTISLAGTNDRPVVTATSGAPVDMGEVTDGLTKTFSQTELLGLAGATDPDHDHLSVSQVSVDAQYGSFAQGSSGEWVFTPAHGKTLTDVPVTMTIGDGHETTSAHGVLDVKHIPLAVSSISQDTGASHTDFITTDNTLIYKGTGTPGHEITLLYGHNPSATVDASGHWTIDASNFNLLTGDHNFRFYDLQARNLITQKVFIAHDKPVLVINNVGGDNLIDSGEHAKPLLISGETANALDGSTVDLEIAGTHYTGTVKANHWQVNVPGHDIAALSDQNLLVHGTLNTVAGMTATAQHHFVIAANPLTMQSSASLKEDASITAMGQVFPGQQVGHVDQPGTYVGNYGELTVYADGSYNYHLNNGDKAIQGLKTGEGLQENFLLPVTETSGQKHSAVLAIKVAGTDDNPSISGTLESERAIKQGAGTHLHAEGDLFVTDADKNDHLSVTVNGQSWVPGTAANIDTDIGRLVIEQNGHWTYELMHGGPKQQAFIASASSGGHPSEKFEIIATDGDGHQTRQHLLVTMAPDSTDYTLRGTLRAAATEDKVTSVSGHLDPVSGVGVLDETHHYTWSVDPNVNGSHGTFTVDDQGNWHYALNNSETAIQSLKYGDIIQDHATIQATDSHGKLISRDVTVDIMGSNDIAVISGHHTASIKEDDKQAVTGQLVGSDADSGETVAFQSQHAVSGTYGHFEIDASGAWSYQLDNHNLDTQHLSGGQIETDTFLVTAHSTDGTVLHQQITVNVSGHEDHPVISGAASGSVTEDALRDTISGHLTATDADTGDKPTFVEQTHVSGSYGDFSIDEHGAWYYQLDNSLATMQGLDHGDTAHESFQVAVHTADGETQTHTVQIEVHGTDEGLHLPPPPPPIASDEPIIGEDQQVDDDALRPYLTAVGAMQSQTGTPLNLEGSTYLNAVGVDHVQPLTFDVPEEVLTGSDEDMHSVDPQSDIHSQMDPPDTFDDIQPTDPMDESGSN